MIRDYWIEAIRNIPDFQEIGETEDTELSLIRDEITNLVDDQFITTANESGIAIREKMLEIQPYEDDTVEDRRFRVGLQWNNQRPYTFRSLEQKLEQLVGPEGYLVTLDNGAYTLLVEISLGQTRQIYEAEKLIRNISPSNLVITVTLRYNRHQDLTVFTHAELAAYTHQQIREEVIL